MTVLDRPFGRASCENLGFEPGAATRWIVGLAIGARPPLRFTRIGGGRSNLTFEVADSAGNRWILRRPPFGRLLVSAHDVVREHHVLSRLVGAGVPAPAAVALADDSRIADVRLLLMEYVDGEVVDASVARTLEPERRRAIAMSLPDALARVHEADLVKSGLTDLGSHAPYAVRQLKRWRLQWEQSRTRDLPAVEAMAVRLERAAPEQHEVTLVHGDFHMLNLMFDRDDPVVRAILDWELCTLGDPLADLGGLLAYWTEFGEPSASGPFAVTAMPGFPTRRELAHAYSQRAGRDITALPFWEALANWKLAVIIEGILRRRLDSPANADRGDEIFEPALVERIIQRAARVLDEAGSPS